MIFDIIKKIVFKGVFRMVLNQILDNPTLQKKLFFFFAREIVKRTDTPADDEFLKIVAQALGEEPDVSDIEKIAKTAS